MSRSPRWLPLLAFGAVVAIVFAACAGAASPSPSASAPGASVPASQEASTEPFTGLSYPESGEAPCGQTEAPAGFDKYAGNFKKLAATDAKTVTFDLCQPDVAFLSKIAFTSFAINDSDYLEKAAADGSIIEKPNGTGPYMLKEWVRGDHITMEANPNYSGPTPPKAPTLIFKWSAEAAQRLVDPVGQRRRDRQRRNDRLRHRQERFQPAAHRAPRAQRLLHRDEQRLQAVRQRE